MGTPELVTVYDFAEGGLTNWTLPLVAVGFALVFAVMILFCRLLPFKFGRLPKWAAIFGMCFALLWGIGTGILSVAVNWQLQEDYDAGRAEIVEGRVDKVSLMPGSGAPTGDFSINGKQFWRPFTGAFDVFVVRRIPKGPMKVGQYVRVWHVRGNIMRLDLERSAVDEAAQFFEEWRASR